MDGEASKNQMLARKSLKIEARKYADKDRKVAP